VIPPFTQSTFLILALEFGMLAGHYRDMACKNPGYRDYGSDHIEIRLAQPRDRDSIAQLAGLDSKPVPSGSVLLGLVDGALAAALPLDGSAPIADPFRPTAGLVSLLRFRAVDLEETRAGQLRVPLRARLGPA
jgi:hypothetical protein